MFKKHKKFLGLPIIGVVVALVAVLSCTAGLVGAQFLFNRQQGATVKVMGSGANLYTDAGCTVPLASGATLDFGNVRASSGSNAITVFLKNTGTDVEYPTIKTNGLDAVLLCKEATKGTIGNTPIALYTAPSYTVPSSQSTTLSTAIDNEATTVVLAAAPVGGGPGSGQFSDTGEVIQWSGTTGSTLTGVVRGYLNSVPTSHAVGATFIVANNTITVITPCVPLGIGAVLPVVLHMETTGDVVPKLGQSLPFQIEFNVTSNF